MIATRDQFSYQEYRSILRVDFPTFVERSFRELNPHTTFMSSQYIELLCSKLQDCCAGEITRLIVNLPPRSLKSQAASVALPAWILGHDPSKLIICASYGQDLAEKHARDCRILMESPVYRELFPKTVLAHDKTAVNDFATTAKGGRMATSVAGPGIGRGGHILILDDIQKPDETRSDARRKNAIEWFLNTLYSRLNDKENGVIIALMQRLHQADLVGELLERGAWDKLILPAIAINDENYSYRRFGKRLAYIRKMGEALHPERESLETLQNTRETIGDYNFQSQYQQAPVSREGGLIKREWIKYYEPGTQPKDLWPTLQSWDTAFKGGEGNDYSVCTTWGVAKNGQRYLLDVYRRRLTFPQLKRAVVENFQRFKVDKLLIEDRGSGTSLIQQLRADCSIWGLEEYAPDQGDKETRLAAQSVQFEAGRVSLPRSAPWLEDYIAEITGFPGTRHDDQVDSTSQALEYLGKMAPWSGTPFRGFGVRAYEIC